MGTPELPDLGKHCSVPECHQLDFLPFTCAGCHKVFCLEHRQYKSHNCPSATAQDVTVLVCPVCAKSVRTVPNEDENVTWERHVQTNCDPSNYAKATKKPRCPVPGCKEMLFFSNKVFCKDCKREICLKHRFGPDHNCEGFRKADSNNRSLSSFGNMFMKSFKERTSLGTQSNSNAKRSSDGASSSQSGGFQGALTGLQIAASSVRTSMEAGMSKLGLMTTPSVSGRQTPAVSSRDQAPQAEECPQCRARFATVGQLIQHVESMHENPSMGEILDVCPKCGKKFHDPISLVKHVERDHRGSSS